LRVNVDYYAFIENQEVLMVNKEYMRMYLSIPDMLRKISISDNQISVVNFVKDFGNGVTSRDLADAREISVQSATQQLCRLSELGYLRRSERVAQSGGKIYFYYYNLGN
jgi:DNA-binding MarR family transcriptional regulator